MKRLLPSALKAAALAAACAALCACESANASYWPLGRNAPAQYGAPKNPEEVEIFITKKPPYQYKEVGIITYETFSAYNDEASVYQIMRERAARAGVDGIIIMNPQEFASFNAYFSPYPRSRRDRHFYDRRGIPDMFRYRAAAIVKQNKK